MNATGPTKHSTKVLIDRLERKAIKEKQKVWNAIAIKLSTPTRKRAAVNVSKISALCKKFPGKTFIIAGKVLGEGSIEEKASVIALEFSKTAKSAIEESKGEAVLLRQAVEAKVDASKLMIVA